MLTRGSTTPTDDELTAFCNERLARYKVPKAWERVDEMPRTGSGKVARGVLEAHERDRRAAPATESATTGSTATVQPMSAATTAATPTPTTTGVPR